MLHCQPLSPWVRSPGSTQQCAGHGHRLASLLGCPQLVDTQDPRQQVAEPPSGGHWSFLCRPFPTLIRGNAILQLKHPGAQGGSTQQQHDFKDGFVVRWQWMQLGFFPRLGHFTSLTHSDGPGGHQGHMKVPMTTGPGVWAEQQGGSCKPASWSQNKQMAGRGLSLTLLRGHSLSRRGSESDLWSQGCSCSN